MLGCLGEVSVLSPHMACLESEVQREGELPYWVAGIPYAPHTRDIGSTGADVCVRVLTMTSVSWIWGMNR